MGNVEFISRLPAGLQAVLREPRAHRTFMIKNVKRPPVDPGALAEHFQQNGLPRIDQPATFLPRLVDMENQFGTTMAFMVGFLAASGVNDNDTASRCLGSFLSLAKSIREFTSQMIPATKYGFLQTYIEERLHKQSPAEKEKVSLLVENFRSSTSPRVPSREVNCIVYASLHAALALSLGFTVGAASWPYVFNPHSLVLVNGREMLSHWGPLGASTSDRQADRQFRALPAANVFTLIAILLLFRTVMEMPAGFNDPAHRQYVAAKLDTVESIFPFHRALYKSRAILAEAEMVPSRVVQNNALVGILDEHSFARFLSSFVFFD